MGDLKHGPDGYLIRDACVVSMDDEIGVLDRGDVLIRDGLIASVGSDLDTGNDVDVEIVDAAGMIVMPGMIETHTHMWNSMHRGLALPYFELSSRLGPRYRPEDSYNAVRLAATEAVASGITTLHNYAHNNQTPQHTDAEIQAMLDSGAHGRYSYAWYQGQRPDQAIALTELARIKDEWDGADGRLQIGFGARNDFELVPEFPTAAADPDVLKREWKTAEDLGLPIVTHAGDTRAGLAEELLRRGYVKEGVLLVHGYYFSPADLRILADQGVALSTCPLTGQRSYLLMVPYSRFREAGVTVCYSFDSTYASGGYDMFRVMRSAVDGECARLKAALPLGHHEALRATTIDAAAAMGIDAVAGSLTPGKRADLVLLDAGLNLAPLTDPIRLIVDSASPGNVDTVFVGGVPVKRAGELTSADASTLRAAAQQSLARVLAAADVTLDRP